MGILYTSTRPVRVLLAIIGLALTPMVRTPNIRAQELPPAIQADRLLLQAEGQIQEGAYGAALATLDRILDLQAEHDLEVPAAFWFKHAQVAMEVGLVDKAKGSATRYLKVTGRGGEHYMAVLELLNEVDIVLAEAERRRAEAERHLEGLLRQAESSSSGRVFRDCEVCPVMVEVPAGSFMMGSPEPEPGPGSLEIPQHRVAIGLPFAVGVYEVTFAEWDACVGAGGCGGHRPWGWGRGGRPVMNVSWEDAQAYVQWLSRETGQRYRLLTEAEWEYVARAGTTTDRYWGQGEAGQCRYANGDDDDAPCPDGYEFTAPVGSYQPNAFGLYDVLGNVTEWTEDCWNLDYSGAPVDGSAWRSGDCSRRVLRGGSWNYGPWVLRSALRSGGSAGYRDDDHGFRVARTIN